MSQPDAPTAPVTPVELQAEVAPIAEDIPRQLNEEALLIHNEVTDLLNQTGDLLISIAQACVRIGGLLIDTRVRSGRQQRRIARAIFDTMTALQERIRQMQEQYDDHDGVGPA